MINILKELKTIPLTEEETLDEFEMATMFVQNALPLFSQDQILNFYGLYKQATCGNWRDNQKDSNLDNVDFDSDGDGAIPLSSARRRNSGSENGVTPRGGGSNRSGGNGNTPRSGGRKTPRSGGFGRNQNDPDNNAGQNDDLNNDNDDDSDTNSTANMIKRVLKMIFKTSTRSILYRIEDFYTNLSDNHKTIGSIINFCENNYILKFWIGGFFKLTKTITNVVIVRPCSFLAKYLLLPVCDHLLCPVLNWTLFPVVSTVFNCAINVLAVSTNIVYPFIYPQLYAAKLKERAWKNSAIFTSLEAAAAYAMLLDNIKPDWQEIMEQNGGGQKGGTLQFGGGSQGMVENPLDEFIKEDDTDVGQLNEMVSEGLFDEVVLILRHRQWYID